MTTIPNDLLECPLCGGAVQRVHAAIPIQVGSRSIPVAGEYSTCLGCGEVFFGPGEMDRAMQAASSVVRDAEGLLHPQEIRAIREGLDLSQAEFERLLGVGPKTVVRWEKGTVFQNGATDSLLRLLRDVPACEGYLRARAGLETWQFFTAHTSVNFPMESWDGALMSKQLPTTQFIVSTTQVPVPLPVPARVTEPAFSEAA